MDASKEFKDEKELGETERKVYLGGTVSIIVVIRGSVGQFVIFQWRRFSSERRWANFSITKET